MAALAKNAADIQQRSFADVVGTNRQALTLMGSAFTNAVMASVTPQNSPRLLNPA